MKKFDFSLQRVLEYNTHIQKKEKDILAEMQYEYKSLTYRAELLTEKYNSCKKQRSDESIRGISITNLIAFDTYLKSLQDQILLLKKETEAMELKIEKQIQTLLSVTKEKTTLEKLKSKHQSDYNIMERKHDELFIDEFVANKASN
jgi:flagellar export protein FliJ